MVWQNDSGNGNSVNVQGGDNVDDAIDNLTNRYDSGGEKMRKPAIRLAAEIPEPDFPISRSTPNSVMAQRQ